MNKTPNLDWHHIRPTLIIVVMSAVFSGALAYLSHAYLTDMQQQHRDKNESFNSAQSQLHDAQDDELIIGQYLQRFEALKNTGMFDSKQRINWVDAVNRARRNMKLPIVSYQIEAQQTFSADYLASDEYAKVKVNHINLEAGLLHESDLVDLFKWMDRYAPGKLHLSHCELKPVEEIYGYYAERPNLTASCELLWLTVHPTDEGHHDNQNI